MNDILKKSSKLMGNHFEISVVTENPTLANEWIEKAFQYIRDIEYQLTTYSETSDTYLINQAAGLHPVQVHPETFALIERCQKISKYFQKFFNHFYAKRRLNSRKIIFKTSSIIKPLCRPKKKNH